MVYNFSESFKSVLKYGRYSFVDYNETKTYSDKFYMRALHANMTRAVLNARSDYNIDNGL